MRQIEISAACLKPDDRCRFYELVKSQLAPRGIDVEAAVQKALRYVTQQRGLPDSGSSPLSPERTGDA